MKSRKSNWKKKFQSFIFFYFPHNERKFSLILFFSSLFLSVSLSLSRSLFALPFEMKNHQLLGANKRKEKTNDNFPILTQLSRKIVLVFRIASALTLANNLRINVGSCHRFSNDEDYFHLRKFLRDLWVLNGSKNIVSFSSIKTHSNK